MEGGEGAHSKELKEEEKKAPGQPPKKPVELRISVFFDGTGNNRGNIIARKGGKHNDVYSKLKQQNEDSAKYSSFEAGFSNVALLEENFKSTSECKIYKAFYVEGVATRDLKQVAKNYANKVKARAEFNKNRAPRHQSKGQIDIETDSDVWGNGMATGSTGLYAKIDRAMRLINDWLDEEIYEKKYNGEEILPSTHEFTKVVVDVFGFSRGAATARHFVHHITEGTRTMVTPIPKNLFNPFAPTRLRTYDISVRTLKAGIELAGFKVKDNAVQIGFAGLFDTVSSFVIALTSDVKILHLDAVKKARKVYHLAAAEEHRACFSLTNIQAAKNAGKGEEYFLPGVHSDIGGGYRDLDDGGGETEIYELMNDDKSSIAAYQTMRIGGLFLDYKAFMREIAGEGWYKPCDFDTWYEPSTTPPIKGGEMWLEKDGIIFKDVALKTHRTGIAHSYRCIPLQLMVEAMEKNDFSIDAKIKSKHKVPGELSAIEGRIRSYVGSIGNNSKAEDWFKKQDSELKTLRNKHLHYSSRIATGHWPRFKNQKRFRQYYDG